MNIQLSDFHVSISLGCISLLPQRVRCSSGQAPMPPALGALGSQNRMKDSNVYSESEYGNGHSALALTDPRKFQYIPARPGRRERLKDQRDPGLAAIHLRKDLRSLAIARSQHSVLSSSLVREV